MLSSGTNVITSDKMLSSGANVIMVSSRANVIIWCYHVMLLSGMITHSFFIFPENFTHSFKSSFRWRAATLLHTHSYITFVRRLSISSSLVSSVGKASLGSRAKNQTRAYLTTSRRTTNWASPRPSFKHGLLTF